MKSEFKFKANDFANIVDIEVIGNEEAKKIAIEAAKVANIRMKRWLGSMPEVYGVPIFILGYHGAYWGPEQERGDTHCARLVCIEAIDE